MAYAWPRIAIAGAMALALAGCSDVDAALFGPYPTQSGDQSAGGAQPAQTGGTAEGQPGAQAQAAPPSDQQAGAEAQSAPPGDASAEAQPPEAQTASLPPQAEIPSSEPPQPEAEQPGTPEGSAAPSLPGTLPPTTPSLSTEAWVPQAPGGSSDVVLVHIQPGHDTGTAVGRTVSGLRGEVSSLANELMNNAHRLDGLRQESARATSQYQTARASILTHLQVGTTRANPELVAQWNTAQSALDQLTANLNAMGALGQEVTNDFTSTRQALGQITAAYDLPGQVDEDHRQLSVLEDETRQMIVSYDRLRKDILADVPRQTAFVAGERASLAQLEGAIKRGEVYGDSGGSEYHPSISSASPVLERTASFDDSRPLVVIKFDHQNVSYEETLLAALKEALKAKPAAQFEVEGIAPTRGSASEVAAAQAAAQRDAQNVLHSMTEMGVPGERLKVASSTDPDAQAAEVRVFVR
jgi:hypothetical protein